MSTFRLRYSSRGRYYFIDRDIGGEDYTVAKFSPDTSWGIVERIVEALNRDEESSREEVQQ